MVLRAKNPVGVAPKVAQIRRVMMVVVRRGLRVQEKKREPVQQRALEAEPAVCLVRLLEAKREPHENAKRVRAAQQRAREGGKLVAQRHLHGVRELGGKPNRTLKLVMLLVPQLVQRAVVQRAVGPVETEGVGHVRNDKNRGDMVKKGGRGSAYAPMPSLRATGYKA